MDRRAITEIVATIRERLDRPTAELLADPAIDPRVVAIYSRAMSHIPFEPVSATGEPHDIQVASAVWDSVKRHDPAAIIIEPPDGHDSGGPTLSGTCWGGALLAASSAAVAYAYPELLSSDERPMLARRWEDVFGPRSVSA